MKFLKKFGPVIGVIAVVGLLLFIVKMQWDSSNERDALNKQMIEMKTLQDGSVRNQSKFVTKDDLKSFADDMELDLSAIQDDLDNFDAEVRGIAKLVASSLGRRATNVPSSGTRPKPPGTDPDKPDPHECPDGEPCPDPYGHLSNSQILALTEPFPGDLEVPIGDVTFEVWKEKPWTINVLPRRYHVATVLGQDEDGRHYIHNKMQIEADGKRHTIPIEQAEFQEVYPESEFRFNPKLHLGIDVGAVISDTRAEIMPNLQISMFTYGRTKTNVDTEWSFLGVGAGFGTQGKTFNAVLTPVNYNLGQHIPLVESLHVGPTITVDHKGDFAIMGGIRVGL